MGHHQEPEEVAITVIPLVLAAYKQNRYNFEETKGPQGSFLYYNL